MMACKGAICISTPPLAPPPEEELEVVSLEGLLAPTAPETNPSRVNKSFKEV